MRAKNLLNVLAVVFVGSIAVSTGSDQTDVIQIPTVAPPPGYVIIEEDRWYLMADEPANHMNRAREAFLMLDSLTAAKELRKAAIQLRIIASNAEERGRHSLLRSEHELEKIAKRIEDGTLTAVDELDLSTAKALHALSEYHYVKAERAWQKKRIQQAGHYLKASADNIELAASKTETRFRAATAEVARESRVISGSLVEGTGYVVDDVGTGFERIGHQIERVGAKLLAPTVR